MRRHIPDSRLEEIPQHRRLQGHQRDLTCQDENRRFRHSARKDPRGVYGTEGPSHVNTSGVRQWAGAVCEESLGCSGHVDQRSGLAIVPVQIYRFDGQGDQTPRLLHLDWESLNNNNTIYDQFSNV